MHGERGYNNVREVAGRFDDHQRGRAIDSSWPSSAAREGFVNGSRAGGPTTGRLLKAGYPRSKSVNDADFQSESPASADEREMPDWPWSNG